MEQSTDAVIALAAAVREQANAFLLRALAERGVTDLLPAHGAVLHALFRQGPLSMSALAEAIDRRKNTVTGLIKTLEERGYCRREPDPADARVQRIVLTARGEGLRGHAGGNLRCHVAYGLARHGPGRAGGLRQGPLRCTGKSETGRNAPAARRMS